MLGHGQRPQLGMIQQGNQVVRRDALLHGTCHFDPEFYQECCAVCVVHLRIKFCLIFPLHQCDTLARASGHACDTNTRVGSLILFSDFVFHCGQHVSVDEPV